MRRIIFHQLWLLVLILWPACSDDGGRAVLLQVNEQNITLADFKLGLLDFASGQELGRLPPRREAFEPMKKEVINSLIEQALLAEEAAKHKIVISPEELRAAIATIEADYPQGSLQKILAANGISYKDWQKKLERSLSARKTIQAISARTPPPSEEELKQVYQNRAAEFSEQPLLQLSQILMRDPAQAENLRRRVAREPKRFAELAREQSAGPEAAAGGEMGLVNKNRLPERIWKQLIKLPAGGVSPVIKSDLGYHIFLVREKTRSKSRSFDEVKSALATEIQTAKRQEAYHTWLKESLRQAKILRNQKLLAGLWDRLVVRGRNG